MLPPSTDDLAGVDAFFDGWTSSRRDVLGLLVEPWRGTSERLTDAAETSAAAAWQRGPPPNAPPRFPFSGTMRRVSTADLNRFRHDYHDAGPHAETTAAALAQSATSAADELFRERFAAWSRS